MRFDFYTPSEVAAILGKRLKQQRLQQNITQAMLAERAGVGVSTIARIESGQGGTLDNLIRMASALGLINELAETFALKPQTIDEVIAAQAPCRQRASNKE